MPTPHSSTGGRGHRSTLSLQKTEIIINVYDLLPPGRVSAVLWTMGTSLLHSGVVIKGKEYAYGGHDQPNLTGVYWTPPKTVPPGGTFKTEILHGFTLASDEELKAVIQTASEEFLGTGYNLLTRNCNHFTSYLCQKLTGTPGPGWLNRAASIGVALPCVVPREWVDPPEYDTADGALLEDWRTDGGSHSLRNSHESAYLVTDRSDDSNTGDGSDQEWDSEQERRRRSGIKGKGRDTSGRKLPLAERAPL